MDLNPAQTTGIINKATGVVQYIIDLFVSFINWVLGVPGYVKFCYFLIFIFLAYCVWEVAKFIKYLQAEYIRQEKLRGNSRD